MPRLSYCMYICGCVLPVHVYQDWRILAKVGMLLHRVIVVSSDHLVHAVLTLLVPRSFLHTMSISHTTSMLISPPGPPPGTQPSWNSSHPRLWTPWPRSSRDTLTRFSSIVTGERRMRLLDWSSPSLQCMVWVVMQWREHSRLSTCQSLFLSLNRLATCSWKLKTTHVSPWGGERCTLNCTCTFSLNGI